MSCEKMYIFTIFFTKNGFKLTIYNGWQKN